MELNSSINTFIGGMNLDADVSLLKENQYRYAENVRLLANEDSTTGVLLNKDCLKRLKSFLKDGEEILGTAVTRLFDEYSSNECIVVITVRPVGNNKLNNIYAIYINESGDTEIVYEHIMKDSPIGWYDQLKIVANYESDTISKIYVTDGVSPIKVLNLATLNNETTYTADMFDILPNAKLSKPKFIGMIAGSLQAGAVAYSYQLFSQNGSESAIAPISTLINIPKKSGSANKDVLGGNSTEVSTFGCAIEIDVDTESTFEYAKIYRIRYNSNNSVANVYVIQEVNIVNNKIQYNDISDESLTEITVDEFNMLTMTEFSAKTIEKHENRLFAAGIVEKSWTTEYDARAYRCDENGNVALHHSDQMLNIYGQLLPDGTIKGVNVSENHDCINPSNLELFNENSFTYMYYPDTDDSGNTVYKLGGVGPNIKYEFCYTKVNISDNKINKFTNSKPSADFTLTFGSSKVTSGKVDITDDNGVVQKSIELPNGGAIKNYADSWFTSNFLGYQRDEIYRFGIVFYDLKSRKSPVYWIGDIRMPSHVMAKNLDDKVLPFHFGEDDVEMTGYSLGIKFTVKSLPQGAVGYDIVRCPRNEIDRTIVSQGAIGSLIQFDDWGRNQNNLGLNDIRPMSLLNCSDYYHVNGRDGSYSETTLFAIAEDYFEFVSPEVCVSKTSIQDNLLNGILCNIAAHSCLLYTPHVTTSDLAIGSLWGTRQQQIYTLDIENPKDTTNTNCGLFGNSTEDDTNILVLVHYISDLVSGEKGLALLLKYYRIRNIDASTMLSYNITNAIVADPLPYVRSLTETKTYAKSIGSKLYVNTTIGGRDFMNNHGTTAVLHTSEGSKSLWFDVVLSEIYVKEPFEALDATWVCNVKQLGTPYGGNKYANRVNSTYVTCMSHVVDDKTVCVYGGDTYLSMFDYTHTTVSQEENDANKDQVENMFINCYIPLETSVNLDLLNTPTYNKLIEKASNSSEDDMGLGQNLILYEPTVTPNYTQQKPLYEYNSSYSADNNAQVFVPNLLYIDEKLIFETRITCSELKTNNEIVDSWTKFKFANYLDVDSQYGPVTNLKSFNGRLFFWLDSSVGVASVNERSLIQDNNISQLTLGVGDILVRYDYYTTINGSSVENDRSICNSVSTLYWYDPKKKEICAINNTVIELSKVKGVKSWCNQLDKVGSIGWYDWKYNEVLFLNPTDEQERSIVFNEQLNAFTGFYTHPVAYTALMTDNLVTLDKKGNVYLQGADENYEPFKSNLKYVVNKGYTETKAFDNVFFGAEMIRRETVNSIFFETKSLISKSLTYKDIENREDTYRFPIPRDKNGVARMRGKYLICDYTFDCTNDGDFKIPYIKTTFRISRV